MKLNEFESLLSRSTDALVRLQDELAAERKKTALLPKYRQLVQQMANTIESLAATIGNPLISDTAAGIVRTANSLEE